MWWITIRHNGQRIRRSTGTSNKTAAQRLHDQIKADLWKNTYLMEKPEHFWVEAVMRWFQKLNTKKVLMMINAI